MGGGLARQVPGQRAHRWEAEHLHHGDLASQVLLNGAMHADEGEGMATQMGIRGSKGLRTAG